MTLATGPQDGAPTPGASAAAPHPARAALRDPVPPVVPAPAPPAVDHPTHPPAPPASRRPGGPWAAWSPCTPQECCPPRATTGGLRLARRTASLLAVLALAAAVVPVAALLGRRVLDPVLRGLHRAVLRAAGVRLVVRGGPLAPGDGRGALVVADHTSWIDIPALGAIGPVTMLAKREVRDWPLIGTLAARTGTLFVHREGLSRLPGTVATCADALRAGTLVGVFPEATTWCGAVSGPYRRAPFQAAIDAGAPVRPVTVSITTPDGRPTTAASFVGEQTLGDTVGRVLRLPGLVCEVTVGGLVEPGPGTDRRALAERARDRVRRPRPVPPGTAG
ncbi:lysophospholipid acyltransferase family protein [Pseudonocardia spirodelae]|uniref:Lysophospholipid acyltransferase family protein n=1 Tax=Pseudonocardia spirodelae TaxID=3133431 RepID=A0ABU8T3Y0_9PSEU